MRLSVKEVGALLRGEIMMSGFFLQGGMMIRGIKRLRGTLEDGN